MSFSFSHHTICTDNIISTEVRDYNESVNYPVHLSFHIPAPGGGETFLFMFHSREAARKTITEMIGKCNGWLADELGVHRELPPAEEVWPEAEQETLSTTTRERAYEALRQEIDPEVGG